MSPRRELDESDVRVRPGRRGSRPRTKERPRHGDALPGWVLAVDRGRYTCRVEDGGTARTVTAMKARELGRAGIVVGDRVDLVGDVSGSVGTLARVVRVLERSSLLRRSADDTDPVERPVVANADQLAVVTALADPPPRTGLVDRCVAAALDAGLDPLLVLTKADLADPAGLLAAYAALEVPAVVLRRSPEGHAGLPALAERLAGRVTALVGHSGVGKSTLVNALVPGADRATGHVNRVTGRGRHTSTSAVVLQLPRGGWVVDTPGIRSFGLAHVRPEDLLRAFPDLVPGTDGCPRACPHDGGECALDAFVAAGGAGAPGAARLESYRRLLASRAGEDDPPRRDTAYR